MKWLLALILFSGCMASSFAPQIYYETVCQGTRKISRNSYETYFKTKAGKCDTVHMASPAVAKLYTKGDKYHIYVDTLKRTAKLKRL